MKIYVLQSICQANPQKCAEYASRYLEARLYGNPS